MVLLVEHGSLLHCLRFRYLNQGLAKYSPQIQPICFYTACKLRIKEKKSLKGCTMSHKISCLNNVLDFDI